MMHIRHIYISPGHNFVGHHGKPPGGHPTVEVDEIECVTGSGLVGDRYFDFKENYKGQITFFAWEVFERMQTELGLTDATPAATRRNVITEGVDLNTLVGQEFEIQGLRFTGTEECSPCYWMNDSFRHKGAEAAMKGHGGLRARILTGGVLRRSFSKPRVQAGLVATAG